MHTLRSHLSGAFATGDALVATLHAAASGAPLARIVGDPPDLRAALRYAREVGGGALRALTFAERGALLGAMAAAIHEAREELIALSVANSGATRKDAKFDIDGAAGTLAWYGNLGRELGNTKVLLDGEQLRISRSKRFVGQHVLTPRRGVAVHINAFNFPAWNMAEKAATALLAGVPVLSKPATATALVSSRIAERWAAGAILPAGAFSLLAGPARDLLDHLEPFDSVVFTGSGDTGAAIRSHPRVVALGVPVNVEADSLNAAVLGPDVAPGSETFELFVREVVHEMTHKAGQKCTAIRRVLVPEATREAAIGALRDALDAHVLGDPAEASTSVGPLSTPSARAEVEQGVAALSEVAERLWGAPDAAPSQGYFVAPQLFLAEGGVDAGAVHTREIFGPVATVLPYGGGVEEAAAIVAAGGGSLVSSVFSDDAIWAGDLLTAIAPYNGRILWGSAKVADQSTGHGTVLPSLVHGGPGKAGGGEELGGERGLRWYMQRTAVQGDAALLRRVFEG